MATLKMLDDKLHTGNEIQNTRKISFNRRPSTATTNALQTALHKVLAAVARYHRAGPSFKKKSEAFWIFAAGSWNRHKFDEEVKDATKKLPKAKSVDEDLRAGKRMVFEAIEVLRKAELMDVRDLEEAWRVFEKSGRW